MKKIDEVWTKIEFFIVGLFSLIAALLGFYGIIMRYVFVQPVGWTEEVITYLMVWALLIILSPVQKDKEHIRMDLIYNKYPDKIRPYIDLLILLLSLVFTTVVIIYGWQIVESLITANQLSQSSLQIPLWIVRLSVPAGFLLLSIRFVQSSILVLKEIKINVSSKRTS